MDGLIGDDRPTSIVSLAATTTLASMAAQAESSSSFVSSLCTVIPGLVVSGTTSTEPSSYFDSVGVGFDLGGVTLLVMTLFGGTAGGKVCSKVVEALNENFARRSCTCEESAALKTVSSASSGGGLPNEVAGVQVPREVCESFVVLLENTVDCDSLIMLD